LTEGSNKLIKSRILVYKRIEHCVARTFPMNNMKTKIFGSCATGLALTTSDVDIAVSGIETYDRATLCDSLSKISEVLKNFKWVLSNKPILTAHVPVLKLEIDPKIGFTELAEAGLVDETKTRILLNGQGPELNMTEDGENAIIKVDLTLESLGMMGYTVHMGYRSTEFAEKMLAQYKSLYIVTIVLKEFLYNHKLLNTFHGGLSSYCLVLMIVALLQKHGDEGYMKIFRRFLKFYGESFQPEKTGITLSEADPFFDLNHSYETAPLWILDHNNYVDRRNIGQGAYSIKLILHEFEKTSNLIDYLQQKCEEIIMKHKGKIHSVDDIWLLEDPELKNFINSNILDSFINCT